MDDYLSFKSKTQEAVVRLHQSDNIYSHLQKYRSAQKYRPLLKLLWILTQRHINQVFGKIMDSQIRPSQLKLQTNATHETLLKPFLLINSPRFNWREALTAICRTSAFRSLIYRQVDHVGTFGPQTSWLTRQLFSLAESIYFHLVQQTVGIFSLATVSKAISRVENEMKTRTHTWNLLAAETKNFLVKPSLTSPPLR